MGTTANPMIGIGVGHVAVPHVTGAAPAPPDAGPPPLAAGLPAVAGEPEVPGLVMPAAAGCIGGGVLLPQLAINHTANDKTRNFIGDDTPLVRAQPVGRHALSR